MPLNLVADHPAAGAGLFIALSVPPQAPRDNPLSSRDLEWVQSLSPLIMRWDEQTYLWDLGPCLGFWHKIAKRRSLRVGSLWQEILQQNFGNKLRAALAPHPWQALTLLAYLRERRLSGFWTSQSPLGRKLMGELSWEAWLAPSDRLIEHLRLAQRRNVQAARFRSQRAQLRRAMERLGCASPGALMGIDAAAMGRRFGSVLAMMWRWSFAGDQTAGEFPWQRFNPPEQLVVTRHLDEVANCWDHLEGWLSADLDLLCRASGFDSGATDGDYSQRVTLLRWSLTVASLETMHLELRFKHPHPLAREVGSHPTALAQARHQFEAMSAGLMARQCELNNPEVISITSWQLEVVEKITMGPRIRGLLFEDEGAGDRDEQLRKLDVLENKLPLALVSYQLRPSFIFRQDFSEAGGKRPELDLESWRLAGLHRPLFVYREPQKLAGVPRDTRLHFLERMDGDYFLALNRKGQAHWLARDQQGQWTCYGIFD